MPRLSYLQILLPRLHAFFLPSLIDTETIPYDGWFAYEDVPLKWHYPLGLLYDLFSGAAPFQASTQESNNEISTEEDNNQLPWRLIVHFADWPEQTLVQPDAEGRVLHDAFINAVKEADFLRNGTAKGIMSLSREDSKALWNAVQERKLIRGKVLMHIINLWLAKMTSTPSIRYPKSCSTPRALLFAMSLSRSTFPLHPLRRSPLSDICGLSSP